MVIKNSLPSIQFIRPKRGENFMTARLLARSSFIHHKLLLLLLLKRRNI
jgi:hypothetical protein